MKKIHILISAFSLTINMVYAQPTPGLNTESFQISEYTASARKEESKKYFPVARKNAVQIYSSPMGNEGVWKIKRTRDFNITGDGSADNWNNAEWLKLPRRSGTGVAYETQVKLLYSDSGIYCHYRCEDHKITATMQEDFLDLWNEDVIEVFFWTDEAVPLYFEYELSPLNFELPLLVPNINERFIGWLPWHYEGSRRTKHVTRTNKNGNKVTSWTAEFFIPYSLLTPMTNIPPEKGTRWRANFYRIDYDQGETTWQWQMVRGEKFHDYERFGTIVFE